MGMGHPTNDHGEIRAWAAVHGAIPVEVSTTTFNGEPTKLGFVFPRHSKSEPEFKPIGWDQFFALFDLLKLSIVFYEGRSEQYELLQMDGREQLGFQAGSS